MNCQGSPDALALVIQIVPLGLAWLVRTVQLVELRLVEVWMAKVRPASPVSWNWNGPPADENPGL